MNDPMASQARLEWSLLALRLGVFTVMFMWTLDKLVNPGHAAAIFENFYGLGGLGPTIMYIIAIIEMVIVLGFVAGVAKFYTYGAVLIFHGVSTLSSYGQYLSPFDNLLFFAAWPMLAACIALFLLRDLDNKWTVSAGRSTRTA